MSSILYVIAILAMTAMLRVPLLAQENSPTQASQSQPQGPPSQPPDFGNARFAFHRVDGGFLRLDLHTGAVASCSQDAAGWTCVPGREERTALDREIARLQRDNAVLKSALLEHGVPLPNDMKADSPPNASSLPAPASGGGKGAGGGEAETVPRPPQTVPPAAAPPPPPAKSGEPDRASRDDPEIERIMTIMERVWRRFVEMMMNIQRDMEKKG